MYVTYTPHPQSESETRMSSPQLVGPVLQPQSGVVKRAVMLLHGVGSNGDDLISLAPILAEYLPDTLFFSPNAPFAFDMAPFGHQWFSLIDRSPSSMLSGAKAAAPAVNAGIDKLRDDYGLKDGDVALLGFSQGTMMSLYAGLRRSAPLAAIVGFSGALIGAESLAEEVAHKTPVCLIHGEWDEVVPFAAMAHAQAALVHAGLLVEAHARPGLPHSIDMEGIEIATQFLRRHFKLD